MHFMTATVFHITAHFRVRKQ